VVNWLWAPFLLVAFTSIFFSPQFVSAARLFLVIVSYWAIFIIPFFILRTSGDLARFILIVFASSLIPLAYGLVEVGLDLSKGDAFRLKSTFTHANIFAFYLVLLIGLVLFVQVSRALRWSKQLRRLFLLFIPILVFLLVMTKTRSAWLAATLVLFVYAVLVDRRFLLFVLLIPVFVSVESTVSDRLLDLQKGAEIEDLNELNAETKLNSFAWREVLWQSAAPWIFAEPVWGYGLESFRFYSPDFFPLTIDGEGIDAHSLYVQIQFEMGLLGIIAFMFLMGRIAIQLTSGMRCDRDGMIVLCALLVVYLVVSYSDNMIYYLAFNWYFYFIMGAACAWSRLQRSAPEVSATQHSKSRRGSAPKARRPVPAAG
jgi:putative inorganic carbon (hco3(-)) transporter